MTPAYLAEIAERDAAGEVAATFADIRQVLGVPVVNLIYRHLAAEGRLEPAWAAIRPNLAHEATWALARALAQTADAVRPRVGPLDPAVILRACVSDGELARARATLAVYERANALNLLAARALVDGVPGTGMPAGAPAEAEPATGSGEILPMADPAGVGDDVRATLNAMSETLASPGQDVLIPSLYRHLASVPPLLRLLWQTAGDALAGERTAGAAAAVRRHARVLAATLPLPVEPTPDESVRRAFERFEPAMATMLVAGGVLGDAVALTR